VAAWTRTHETSARALAEYSVRGGASNAAAPCTLESWCMHSQANDNVAWMWLVSTSLEAVPLDTLWSGFSADLAVVDAAPPSGAVDALRRAFDTRRDVRSTAVKCFKAYRTAFRSRDDALSSSSAAAAVVDNELMQVIKAWTETILVDGVAQEVTRVSILTVESRDLVVNLPRRALVDADGRATARLHEVGRELMGMLFPGAARPSM